MASSNASASVPPAYLVLGHGTDLMTPFDERKIVPEGVIVMMWVEAGVAADPKDACPVIRVFRDPTKASMIAKPLEHLEEWRSLSDAKLRVYTPGMRLPNVTASMATTWTRKLNPAFENDGVKYNSGIIAMRSGIYSYPLTAPPMPKDFPIEQIGPAAKAFNACEDDVGYVPDDLNENGNRIQTLATSMYEGNLIPVFTDFIEPQLMAKKGSLYRLRNVDPLAGLQSKTTRKLYDLIDTYGKGLYVFPVCRSFDPDMSAYGRYASQLSFIDINDKDNLKESKMTLKSAIRGSHNTLASVQKYREALSTLSEANVKGFEENLKETAWAHPYVPVEEVEREMNKVRLHRTLSNLQQKLTSFGGRQNKKTRRRQRRSRQTRRNR